MVAMYVRRISIFAIFFWSSASFAVDGGPLRDFIERGGDLQGLQRLCATRGDIPAVVRENSSVLLITSVKMRRKDLTEWLLSQGADANSANDKGASPLLMAAYGGDQALFELLLARGAKFDPASAMGGEPFMNVAARGGSLPIIRFALAHQADVNIRNGKGASPLFSAASEGHLAAVDLLLSNGADIGTSTNDGNTVLHAAAASGNFELAKLLVQKGAPIKLKNRQDKAAYELAKEAGYTKLAIWLGVRYYLF